MALCCGRAWARSNTTPGMQQALPCSACPACQWSSSIVCTCLQADCAPLCLQVVQLCRKHRLYSALTYISNRGLLDYTAPAAQLLLAHLQAASVTPAPASAGATAEGSQLETSRPAGSEADPATGDAASGTQAGSLFGYKLLVYLRCCLTGKAFPPGGSLRACCRLVWTGSIGSCCLRTWSCTAVAAAAAAAAATAQRATAMWQQLSWLHSAACFGLSAAIAVCLNQYSCRPHCMTCGLVRVSASAPGPFWSPAL